MDRIWHQFSKFTSNNFPSFEITSPFSRMELLRDGVDLQALSGKALTTGDAQFFDDASNPPKIKECLDSNNVCKVLFFHPRI